MRMIKNILQYHNLQLFSDILLHAFHLLKVLNNAQVGVTVDNNNLENIVNLEKWDILYKERICTLWEQILSLKSRPLFRSKQNNFGQRCAVYPGRVSI